MTRWPVANPWPGAPVLYMENTRSTMEDALRLGEQGYPSGTVVAAGYQERGRGRLPERTWEAEKGKSLLFTVLLSQELSFPAQRLPVLAGLALSLALEARYGLRTEVKWPNDLLCKGRKLGGILCEAQSGRGEPRFFLIGIGLNCNQRAFPAELSGKACSLAQLLDLEVERKEVLEAALSALHAVLEDRGWRAKLRERLYALGRQVAVHTGASGRTEAVRGVLEDVADDGALLLRPAGAAAPVALYSGELQLRE